MDALLQLVGEWVGTGEGAYPTITPFTYQETTRFTHDGVHNQLHYDQRTLTQTADGGWVQSHWECGFLLWQDDNVVHLCSVQGGGRFEKLRGIVSLEDGLRIDFESDFLGNDERMQSSARVWNFKQDIFSYEMSMATHTTPEPVMQFHLGARLERKSTEG